MTIKVIYDSGNTIEYKKELAKNIAARYKELSHLPSYDELTDIIIDCCDEIIDNLQKEIDTLKGGAV